MKIKIFNGVNFNLKRSLFVLVVLSFILLAPAFKASAVTKTDPIPPVNNNSGKIENPIKQDNINDFIQVILKGVIKISIPIIALAIIYSGFLFVSARGNSEKLGKAKDALLYTCIGAAILLGSWAIAQIISNTVLAL